MQADENTYIISALLQETLKLQLNEKFEILNSIRRKRSKQVLFLIKLILFNGSKSKMPKLPT
jgi:hypothetical protein